MRKPSKLLSLFLAFVMVLTSLSVGFVAFAAPDEWKSGDTFTAGDGGNITENIQAIAAALYGSDFANAPLGGSRIQSLLDQGSSSPYYHHGTYIIDDEYGNGYTIVKNAFEIHFNNLSNDIDDGGGKTIAAALKRYMGDEDFATISQWEAKDPWYWPTMFGAYWGDWNDHATSTSSGGTSPTYTWYWKQSSVATVIALDPAYYLWNAYGDVLADLNDDGILPTFKTFYWQNGNTGTTSTNTNGNTDNAHWVATPNDPSKTALDKDSDAILVNVDELKAFGELFTDIWENFGAGEFDKVPSGTFTDILTTGMPMMEAIRDNTNTADFSGLKAIAGNVTSPTATADNKTYVTVPDTLGTEAVEKELSTDSEATRKIFEHFFPVTAEGIEGATGYDKFEALYESFIEWMVERFRSAVETIGESYTGGVINSGLDFDAFTALKKNFDDAYNIWVALPSELIDEAPELTELKAKLDAYYFNEDDSASNITSFVPAWNNANAQAYIDAAEKLEFASGENYEIKNDAEHDRVKELLDAAAALYGDLYWESSYEDKPEGKPNYSDLGMLSDSLLFESESGADVQGGADVVAHAKKVWDGAYRSYIEYFYRRFIGIASANLDEYVTDTNGNGKIDEGDAVPNFTLNLVNMIVYRTKMQKVQEAYNILPEEVQERALVKFYMSIVANIEKAIDALGDWSKYDVEDPYYYNWDQKKKEIDAKDDVKALLNGLNELVGSPVVLDLVSDMLDMDVDTSQGMGKFARQMVENLIMENADSIIQGIMSMIMPMVKQALLDYPVTDLPAGLADRSAYEVQRNGISAMLVVNIRPEILYCDPDMFNNTSNLASSYRSDNNYDGINAYTDATADKNLRDAAAVIARAGADWEKVDWDNVHFEVKDVHQFGKVVATILRMIDKLAKLILFDEQAIVKVDCGLADDITMEDQHTKGYEKDLVPMLEALGITGLPDFKTAKGWADSYKWDTFINTILDCILDSVEHMFEDEEGNDAPVNGILKLLPNLAYMLYWDKLTGPVFEKDQYDGWVNDPVNGGQTMPADVTGIGDLLAPLTQLASLSLSGLTNGAITHIDGAFINEMLAGIKLGDTGIVLPEISWAAILGLGEMTTNDPSAGDKYDSSLTTSRTDGFRKHINGIPEDVLLYFVEYISELISTNSDAIHDLVAGMVPEGNDTVDELFEELFANFVKTASDPAAFGAVLMELGRGVENSDYDWADMSKWKNAYASYIDYDNAPYTKKYVTNSIDNLAALVDKVLNGYLFKDEDGIVITAEEKIFSGDLINTLFKAIYGLDSSMIETVLKLVEVTYSDGSSKGIDISLETTKARLAAYPQVVAAIDAWEGDYFVIDEPTGEYEITCHYKDEVGDGEEEPPECGTKIKVTAAEGTVPCPTCGHDVQYTADDAKVLTKPHNFFDDETITADMWNITDAASFKTALVTILEPFRAIFESLLAGKGTTTSVAKLVQVPGDNGYENAIRTVLSILGVGSLDGTTLMTAADFNADPSKALDNIIDMLLDLVSAFTADPVNSFIDIIPDLARFIDNNGIQNLITFTLQPFWNVISAVLDLVQVNNDFVPEVKGTSGNRIYKTGVFDLINRFLPEDAPELTWATLDENLVDLINVFLKDIIKFKEVVGYAVYCPDCGAEISVAADSEGNVTCTNGECGATFDYTADDIKAIEDVKASYGLVLPAIYWSDLAGSRKTSAGVTSIDREQIVVRILRYVWRIVTTNEPTITALLEEKVGEFWGKINKYIAIDDYEEDDFVYLVLTIINGLDSSDYDSTDIWEGILNAVYEPNTNVAYPVDENGKKYNEDDVMELVDFISGVAMTAAEEFIEGFDFDELGGTIYNSAIPVLIAENVLPLFESAASAFDLLGISCSYNELLAALAGYPDVVAAIEAQGVETLTDIDWAEIAENNLFGIEDSAAFCDVVVTLLAPFMPLLDFILNSGALLILDIVPLVGANGYANAVLPLLQTLGIDAVDAETYAADAQADPKNLLADIINPLFAWVDAALAFGEGKEGPAGMLLSVLPNLAKFFDQGGLQQFIGDITYPFSNLINTIMDILTHGEQNDIFALGFEIAMEMLSGADAEEESDLLTDILDMVFGASSQNDITWYNFHEKIFDLAAKYINIEGATISVDKNGNLVLDISVSGNPMTIVVPKYDLGKVAGITSTGTKRATDSLLVIWQYIWDGILNNKTTMASVKKLLANELGDTYTTKVLGTKYALSNFIENFITSEGNELVAAFIQMERALDTSDYDDSDRFYGANGIFTNMFDAYTEMKATDYPGLKDTTFKKTQAGYYYNENDIIGILDTFQSLVDAIVSIAAGYETEDITANLLYKEDIVALVAPLVVQVADNETLQTILPMLGVEFTKESFAAKLTQYGYNELAAMVEAAESLSAINWDKAAALFYIDDEDAFKANVDLTELSADDMNAQFRFTRAITVILSPFSGLLNALLNGEEMMIANVLPFAGPMSYGNAIKPLLDAFGCEAVDLDAFAAQTEENPDYLLFNIINPILAQIDKLVADPTGTLDTVLPTLAAFIGNSGLERSIINILYPVTQMINPLFRLALPDDLAVDKTADTLIFDVALTLFGFDFKFEDLHDNIFAIIAKTVNVVTDSEIATVVAKTGNLVINITINGNKLPLVIPKYDLDAIAGCGVSDSETKRTADAFVTIFRYFTEILRVNADDFILPAIESVIDDADIFAVVKDYISNVIKPKEKDAVLITLIRLIKNLETSDFLTDERWQEIGKLKDGVADVEYPAPQTLKTITTAIKTLSETAIAAANVFAGIDLSTLTADKLYSNGGSLISTIASIILPLGDNNTVKQILGFIGVDLAKDSIAAHLSEIGLTKIAAAITAADKMEDVDFAALADAWNATDAEGFSKAIAAVFSPFADLLGVLLLPDSSISIADGTFELDGAFGYRNAIKPLLEALGADPVNSDEYVEMAAADSDNILFNIIYPLLAKVDAFAADPVSELLLTLPNLVNYLKDGGLQLTIENLLYPIVNPLDPIIRLVTGNIVGENEIEVPDEEFYDIVIDIFLGDYSDTFSWSKLHEQIYDVAAVVINKYTSITAKVNKDGSLTINDIIKLDDSGKTVSVTLPNIMKILDKIANCGNPLDLSEYGNGYATGDKTPAEIRANTFVALIEILWDIADINEYSIKSVIKNLTGDATYESVKNYVNRLFENEGGDIVNAVVAVINSIDASGYTSKAEWKALLSIAFDKTVVAYPKDKYTSSDITFVINTVSELLTNVLDEFANLQLADLAKGYVYKDSYVSAIAKIIVNLGANGSVADILKFVGVDLSKDAIADKLQAAGFANVAKAIKAAASADAIDWNAIKWNANSAEGFAKALAAVISPLETVLAYVLTAGEINISDVLTITGANGYDNAVKYLLEEAFGCTGLKASSEYANVTELMTAVLKAVFDKIDTLLASDNIVGTVLDAIPQLSAFVARGGVQQFVEDLLYPITNFINPIVALVYDGNLFEFAFDLLGSLGVVDLDVNWKTIHNDLADIANSFLNFNIKGANISITLNKNLTWAKLAGCATRPDTLLTILSYIWENVQGNKAAVETLLKSLLGENTFAQVSEYVNNFLSNTDKDIAHAVVKLFRGFNASAHKADWSFLFKNYTTTNVKYPEGVTSADIEEIVEILTVAIENALDIFLNTSLPTLTGDLIYTDSIVNAVKNIINSLAGNDTVKTVFGLLGLEINVNNKTYTVTDKESFAAALDDILTPFKPILEAFLKKGDITIGDVVTLTGADGFNNAVKPLLEYALGCTNVTDSSIKGIILAVLDRVDEILANPVEELVDLLPMISNFIGKGGVQYFVEELFYPVLNIADAIVSLITKDTLFDLVFDLLGADISWKNAQNEIIPIANAMLNNVNINGKSYSITIPAIDWLKLGGCGKLSGTSIKANTGDVIMTLFEYIFKALEANKAILFDLVGADSTVGQIIANVLEQGAGGMVKIFVNILLKMDTFDNVEWIFKNISHVVTTYTPNYGEEDYAQFVQDIDEAIFGLLGGFVDINIGALLNDMVYKNSIVNTVAKLVYTNLEKINLGGISIHQILKAIDLDITTATVADMLSDFSVASKEIGAHGAWAEVNFDAITWNFEDGDKAGFINALSAALRPIQPLIRVILSGEDLIVLGSIEIKGGNGYNTTVIPLLEALGVSPAALVSPQKYSEEADTDKVLTSVLTPVLDLAETLLNKPILTLSEMLPNIAYFLLNGGAEAIVRNIAGPVFNILEEVAPIYDLNVDQILKDAIGFGISDLGSLDLDELVNTLLASIKINGQELTIRITDIDLETLAGRGELVTYRSARTYNGVQMNAKKVVADAPAVFVSVLRYIIENLKANLDAIKELLAGLGLSGEIADMIDMVLGFLTDLDVDMVIEELLGLLFGTGGGGESNNGGVAPYEVRSLGSIYWTIVALATAFMCLVFLAVFSKKKKAEPEAEAASEAEGE